MKIFSCPSTLFFVNFIAKSGKNLRFLISKFWISETLCSPKISSVFKNRSINYENSENFRIRIPGITRSTRKNVEVEKDL